MANKTRKSKSKRPASKRKRKRGAGGFFSRLFGILLTLIVISAAVMLALYVCGRFSKSGGQLDGVGTGAANRAELEEAYSSGIRFDFIDAGQSDSTLITTPNEKRILIDTGTSEASPDVLGFLEDSEVTSIDYLILTHPHSDHIGGAAEILTIYDVGCIIMPNVAGSGSGFEQLLGRIQLEKRDGCKVFSAEPGDVYTLDGCTLEIHGPVYIDEEELNNSSIVMTVRYGDFTALFSGDAQAEAERSVLETGSDIDCELLKVGHHGSSTSSTSEFLDAASPAIGIISCGKGNAYGHPHSEVIKSLRDRGITYYATSENGNISVLSDGSTYGVITGK